MMVQEDYLLGIDASQKKKIHKSMTIIDHMDEIGLRRISRASSDTYYKNN